VWLGAAVALLEQSPYDLKTLGAQLTLALLLQADRTDVRWNEAVLVKALEGCLNYQHEPLLRAALPALVLAVITIDGDAQAPEGPLRGGVGPLKTLQMLLENGLRETNLVRRGVFAEALAQLYDHLGARAVVHMGAGIAIAISVLGCGRAHSALTLRGLGLLAAIVTTCWPRTHAYMRDIVQATLRTSLESSGHMSERDEQSMTREVTIILHALHAAHPAKLATLLAPARTSLPPVEDLLVSIGLGLAELSTSIPCTPDILPNSPSC